MQIERLSGGDKYKSELQSTLKYLIVAYTYTNVRVGGKRLPQGDSALQMLSMTCEV